MRSEQEMMDLILGVAKGDERIRAVVMNGSRTNSKAPKDPFQDYDIVYLVTELDSFIADKEWIDVFGERIIMQTPDEMPMFPSASTKSYGYLMLFIDGNRIDLTLELAGDLREYKNEDRLTVVLLDKDNLIPSIPPPTDANYWVKPPSAEFFADCCNEFWWVTTYVAKGLWRNEILYAQDHLNTCVRPMLIKMLEWKVGIQENFEVSIGKSGKYLDRYLSEETWQALLGTFAGGTSEDIWDALFNSCHLFRTAANFVSQYFGYEYPYKDDERVMAYLKRVRSLPSDATTIY